MTAVVEKTSFADLSSLILAEYAMMKRPSTRRLKSAPAHLSETFKGYRASQIATDRLQDYIAADPRARAMRRSGRKMARWAARSSWRSRPGRSHGPVYLEPQDRQRGRRRHTAVVRGYRGGAARRVEGAHHVRVVVGLAPERSVRLTWDEIDFEQQAVKLLAARTKNGEAQTLPMFKPVADVLYGQAHSR